MHYEFIAIPDAEVPQAIEPVFQHVVTTYASEVNKTVNWLAKRRLPQFAQGTTAWWLEAQGFFGCLKRQRVWVFWRRVLHTCHHRTQVQPGCV